MWTYSKGSWRHFGLRDEGLTEFVLRLLSVPNVYQSFVEHMNLPFLPLESESPTKALVESHWFGRLMKIGIGLIGPDWNLCGCDLSAAF